MVSPSTTSVLQNVPTIDQDLRPSDASAMHESSRPRATVLESWRPRLRKHHDLESGSASAQSSRHESYAMDEWMTEPNPVHARRFEEELSQRLRGIAARKISLETKKAEDAWAAAALAELLAKYTSQYDWPVPCDDAASPTFEGSVTYLSMATRGSAGGRIAQEHKITIALDDPIAIRRSLDNAQTQWDSLNVSKLGDDGQTSVIRWIHLPANNMRWVEAAMPHVIATAQHAEGIIATNEADWDELAETVLRPEFWQHQCRTNQENPIFSRAMKPFATCVHKEATEDEIHPEQGNPIALAAFMPYLHWESSIAATYMRHVVDDVELVADHESTEMAASQPDSPSTTTKSRCADEILLRKFLTDRSFIHTRRTLDQFYYPYEDKTGDRDHDQVVGRYVSEGHFDAATELDSKPFDLEPPILMVDQCWVWAIGSDTVLTAFPRTWTCNNIHEDPLDLQERILRNIRKPPHPKIYLKSSTWFARFIIRQSAVNLLEPSNRIQEHEKFMLFFDYAIGRLRQRKTDHLKKLWKCLQGEDKNEDEFLDTKVEYQMLEEAQDILEELCMIQELVRLQDRTIEQFEKAQKHFLNRMANPQGAQRTASGSNKDISMLDRPSIKERRNFVARLVQRAKDVNADVNQLLILKQQQAGIREARYTRTLTEQGGKQSSSIMLFTIVTMFFLPLSTLAAMFGINSKTLGSGSMGLGIVFAYIFPISITSVGFFLVIGLNDHARQSMIELLHIAFISVHGDSLLRWCEAKHTDLSAYRKRMEKSRRDRKDQKEKALRRPLRKTSWTTVSQNILQRRQRASNTAAAHGYWNKRRRMMTSMYSARDSGDNLSELPSGAKQHSGRTSPSFDHPQVQVTDLSLPSTSRSKRKRPKSPQS